MGLFDKLFGKKPEPKVEAKPKKPRKPKEKKQPELSAKDKATQAGEPYINYDLQTLQIGTDQGDVSLATTSPTATSAVASLSSSNFVSTSYLEVVNDAKPGEPAAR